MIYPEDNITKHWWQIKETSKHGHELTMMVDCGSPSTIISVENFRQTKQQYTSMIQSGFEYRQFKKHYELGSGRNRYPHSLRAGMEVLNQPRLLFLFDNKSLTRVKGTFCFGDHTLTIDWGNKRLYFPINQRGLGQFHFQLYPMAQAGENYPIRESEDRAKWTKEDTQRAVTHIALEKKSQVEKIIHLHQTLDHAHPDKIENVVKKIKMWGENTVKAINDPTQCKVCAVEHSRLSRPSIAAPRAVSHKRILAIDLKENRSKFRAACFINNKKGATIAEYLVTEWFKHHSSPKYIMRDQRAELLNDVV